MATSRATFLVAFLVFTGSQHLASGQDTCEWLLRYGIFDEQGYFIDRYSNEHFRSLLQHTHAKTLEDFKTEAGSVGLSVPGLFDLKFGGQDASHHFEEWRDAFLNSSSKDLLQTEKTVEFRRTINDALMDAVKQCIAMKKGLTFWVTPGANDLDFTFNIQYRSQGPGDVCLIENIEFRSGSGSITSVADPNKLIARDARLQENGVRVGFRRNAKTDPMNIIINTTRGGGSISIPSVNDDDPITLIRELNSNLANVQLELSELKNSISRKNIFSQRLTFSYQSEGNDWSVMNDTNTPPNAAGGHRQFRKSIRFPADAQFEVAPELVVALTGFTANNLPGAQSFITVRALKGDIYKDNFILILDTFGGTAVQSVEVECVAIRRK